MFLNKKSCIILLEKPVLTGFLMLNGLQNQLIITFSTHYIKGYYFHPARTFIVYIISYNTSNPD